MYVSLKKGLVPTKIPLFFLFLCDIGDNAIGDHIDWFQMMQREADAHVRTVCDRTFI